MGAIQQVLVSLDDGLDPIEMDVLWRLTQGTSGNILTIGNINAGLLGATAFTSTRDPDPFNQTEALDITPSALPVPLSCAGTTVSSVSKAANFDLTLGLSEGATPLFGSNTTNFDIADAQGSGFSFPQFGSRFGDAVVVYLHGDSAGNSTLSMPLDPTKEYLVSVRGSESDGYTTMEVYDIAAQASIGAITTQRFTADVSYFTIQDYLLSTDSAGGSIQVSLWGMRENTAVFPFWDYVAPTPASLVRSQTGLDEITLTANILTPEFEVFRSVDGGAYGSLGVFETKDYSDTTTLGPITFEDSTVSDGQVLLYRIFAKLEGHTSAVGQYTTITVDNAPFEGFEPDDLPNLVRWIKSDALGGGLSDGDPISTASDSSGNGNSLTQTGSLRPTFETNVVGSLPAMLFDRAQTQHLLGTAVTGTEKSFAYAFEPQGLGALDLEVMATDAANTYYRFAGDGNGYFGPFRNARINGYPSGVPISGVIVVAGISTSTGYEIWINGVPQGPQSADFSSGSGDFILGGNVGLTRSMNGYIFEYVEYNDDIGSTDIVNLSNYLAGRWS